ncbi:hypothetical protein Poli38472_014203 [Pythium oligandrum]|uniref:START domain-containing protein n=1 Tax=Pythium oligandrum TaxID=41045 RepID=A0A8K1CI94_PYTOL|nr:hypothetical protein Poli38472_014203 [Pythium oligandrum]|eukprot:TMW64086.1 hypothetical protein Poli38472_014203 [Pythium oligandrum]
MVDALPIPLLEMDDQLIEESEQLLQDIESSRLSEDERSKRSRSERQSRQRRQANLERMREQVKTLQWIVKHADEVQEAETTQSATQLVDPDTARVQSFLQRSLVLTRKARKLKHEESQMRRLMREHELAQKLLRSWVEPPKKSPWELDIDVWNGLSAVHFKPWTMDDCVEVMKASLEMIHDLSQNKEFVSSGCEFMGWTDRRRVDIETSTLHFSFSKSFANCDTQSVFENYWDMHYTAEKLCQHMLGWSNKLHVELLQKVSDDICIFRRDVQYPGIDTRFHTVYIMFRLRSPKGFIHCIRTIPTSLTRETLDPEGGWMNNFHWTMMDYLPDPVTGDLTGSRVTFSGLISSPSIVFVNRWMMELAVTVIRAESSFVSPMFLCP